MPSQAFGQRQPPLYVAIQKILDKYPDGQIFKVQIYYIIIFLFRYIILHIYSIYHRVCISRDERDSS